MNDTAFGLMMVSALLIVGLGMATWANWPLIRKWCQKHIPRSH